MSRSFVRRAAIPAVMLILIVAIVSFKEHQRSNTPMTPTCASGQIAKTGTGCATIAANANYGVFSLAVGDLKSIYSSVSTSVHSIAQRWNDINSFIQGAPSATPIP